MAAEKEKVWQNQRIYKHEVRDTMRASEMSCNIYNITTYFQKQGKRIRELERADDDSAPAITEDYKDTNILGDSNKNNESSGRQTQSFKMPNT